MAFGTISAVRRRNVTPTSSILRIVTRDVDCSAFAAAPEDGQFVVMDITNNQSDVALAGNALTFEADDAAALSPAGATLKMVWSSALQTDRQALGNTKVPVLFLGGVEVECKLLNHTLNGGNAQALSSSFPVGALVTVAAAQVAVQGSTARLVISPLGGNGAAVKKHAWVVGYVTKTTSDIAAADKSITVMLYDQARKVVTTTL